MAEPRCYHCGHLLDHIDAPCPICLPNFGHVPLQKPAPETVCIDGTWYDRRDTVDALTSLLADERGKSAEWEALYRSQAAEYKVARERLIVLADECIADREKVAAMMIRVSIATGHGDTIDALLAELEAAIIALQVKEEHAYENGYEHGHADAVRQSIEAETAQAQRPAPDAPGSGPRPEGYCR